MSWGYRTLAFKPCPLLIGPHRQTIWPLLSKASLLDNKIEQLELSDGDFLDINWFDGGGRVVIVMHGLGGSLQSHYAIALMNALKLSGYTGVFMHFRSCSGEQNRLPRAYHSGDTVDFATVHAHVREVMGRQVYAAVGFSLGGNVLLKYLGETGADSGLQKAVAVSVPFNLAASAEKLSQGTSRIYQRYLIDILKDSYRQKFVAMPSPISPDLERINTFFDYDEAITAPLHNFDGVMDYYTRSSCAQYIDSIETDTLVIHALDDPFVAQRSIPDQVPNCVSLDISQHGGHMGFVGGRFRPKPWLPGRILSYLRSG